MITLALPFLLWSAPPVESPVASPETAVEPGAPVAPPPSVAPAPSVAPSPVAPPPVANAVASDRSSGAALPPGAAAPRFTPLNQDPLPPPPPDAPAESIARAPWRGDAWVRFGGLISGPVDAARNWPASSNATALGFLAEIGYRPQPWIGLGIGVTQIAHDVDVFTVVDSFGRIRPATVTGNLTAWELLIIRGWLPGGPRVQPWIEVATGLATIGSATPRAPNRSGVHFRAGAGIDAWIAPRWSLDFGLLYRLINAGAANGHTLGGTTAITYHW